MPAARCISGQESRATHGVSAGLREQVAVLKVRASSAGPGQAPPGRGPTLVACTASEAATAVSAASWLAGLAQSSGRATVHLEVALGVGRERCV